MRTVLFTFMLCCYFTASHAQNFDFYREYIRVELKDSTVEINGIYQLRNPQKINEGIEMNLFYPFPLDSVYGEVNNIYAFEILGDSSINKLGSVGQQGASVNLRIPSHSEKTLYIGYTQKLLGNKAEYILTTTKKWNTPLESSEIELIIPSDIKIENISYQPNDSLFSEGRTHYYIKKMNFMPEKNFAFEFRKNIN